MLEKALNTQSQPLLSEGLTKAERKAIESAISFAYYRQTMPASDIALLVSGLEKMGLKSIAADMERNVL